MKTASLVFIALVFAMGIQAPASAQCLGPAPLPPCSTCPAPAAQPGIASTPNCPACYAAYVCTPANLGAGPAPDLAKLGQCDFDNGYITAMRQLHANIAALASQGAQQASSAGLRDMSRKIRDERLDQDKKLNSVWAKWHCGAGPAVCPDMSLACGAGPSGCPFEQTYVNTMIALLQQERCAAELAASRATDADLRNQAKVVARADANEIAYLQRWQADHPLLVPVQSACPAVPQAVPQISGTGAGPMIQVGPSVPTQVPAQQAPKLPTAPKAPTDIESAPTE